MAAVNLIIQASAGALPLRPDRVNIDISASKIAKNITRRSAWLHRHHHFCLQNEISDTSWLWNILVQPETLLFLHQQCSLASARILLQQSYLLRMRVKSVQSTLSHLILTSVSRAMFTRFLVDHGLF